MRYGSTSSLEERSKNDLGRFGLGLKTASLSQCRKLTVISKKDGLIYAACWDIDYIIEKENWALILYSRNEIVVIFHICLSDFSPPLIKIKAQNTTVPKYLPCLT